MPIFTFLDGRLRPDDNIDSGGRRGEVGDMKLFCRRFAAPQKRVRKCGKLCERMKDRSDICWNQRKGGHTLRPLSAAARGYPLNTKTVAPKCKSLLNGKFDITNEILAH